MTSDDLALPIGKIERQILLIRGQKVMLDADLARLYGVTTKRLNEQVRRNIDRFPSDFMFHLTWEEARILRSQNATLENGSIGQDRILGRGRHRKYPPYAFTEHGAIRSLAIGICPRSAVLRNVI